MKSKTLWIAFFAVVYTLSLMASQAHAVRIKSTSNTSDIIHSLSTTRTVLTYSFTTLRSGPVAFFYAAECAVDGGVGNTINWLNIDIVVDGAIMIINMLNTTQHPWRPAT